jgi:hypothetical protein
MTIDCFIKWSDVKVLKTLKDDLASFMYERIMTWFGIPLEMVLDNGPQSTSNVVKQIGHHRSHNNNI